MLLVLNYSLLDSYNRCWYRHHQTYLFTHICNQIKRDRSDFQAKLTLKEKTQTELEKKLVRKETQVKKLDEFSRSLLDKLNHTKRDLQLGAYLKCVCY